MYLFSLRATREAQIVCQKSKLETIQESVLSKPEAKRIIPIPLTYEAVTESVMIRAEASRQVPKEGGCLEETIPAQYQTISKKVIRTPATFKEETIPAQYATRTRKRITKKGKGGNPIPARMATMKRLILKANATFKEEIVPAVYTTYRYSVLKTPAICKTEAAVYKTVSVKRLVKAATCSGDTSKIQRIQHPAESETIEILDATGKRIRTDKIEIAPEYFTYQIVEK